LRRNRIQPFPVDATAPPLNSTSPLRVALLVEPTPFTHVSGYANRFNEMLRYLSKANDTVTVLTTDDVTANQPTSAYGFNVTTTLGFRFPLYDHVSVTFDVPEVKGYRLLESFKPDVLHLTSPGFLLFPGLLYARLLRIPVLMSYHTHLPLYAKKYLPKVPFIEAFAWSLIKFAHKRADLTLATSPQMKKELVGHGVRRVDVWRKGIDVVRFNERFKCDEMRARMGGKTGEKTDEDDFIICYIGRLGAEKRLVDLKPVLKEMGDKVKLCIVGTGPQEQYLHEYFKGTNTVFLGQLSGDELSRAFASADVFVMPSDTETLGFVVLESMASGVPVVGCKAGGIVDLIEDGKTGFLVAPGNTRGYVDRLRKLRGDREFRTRMGRDARREAEKWGWEAATSVLRNVQYPMAIQNFKKRGFGGYGAPRTALFGRLLRHKLLRLKRWLRGVLGRGVAGLFFIWMDVPLDLVGI
jgi:sulfoquinovosyltransferase